MATEFFVQQIKRDIVDENTAYYVDILENFDISELSGDFWYDTIKCYRTLSSDEKKSFDTFIRQIIIDTLSNIFGIVDGTVDFPTELELRDESDNRLEDIQDHFLSLIEDSEQKY